MKFLELAKLRYSSRNYLDKPVEQEKLSYILECGRVAPSAANHQPWHFVVITEREHLAHIAKAYQRDWFRQAPVVIVICGDHQTSWKRPDGKDHCDIDIAITTDHMTLAATEIGLASCWICHFDTGICKTTLGLPAHIEPIVILSLGYPGDKADVNRFDKARKKMDEILHFQKF